MLKPIISDAIKAVEAARESQSKSIEEPKATIAPVGVDASSDVLEDARLNQAFDQFGALNRDPFGGLPTDPNLPDLFGEREVGQQIFEDPFAGPDPNVPVRQIGASGLMDGDIRGGSVLVGLSIDLETGRPAGSIMGGYNDASGLHGAGIAIGNGGLRTFEGFGISAPVAHKGEPDDPKNHGSLAPVNEKPESEGTLGTSVAQEEQKSKDETQKTASSDDGKAGDEDKKAMDPNGSGGTDKNGNPISMPTGIGGIDGVENPEFQGLNAILIDPTGHMSTLRTTDQTKADPNTGNPNTLSDTSTEGAAPHSNTLADPGDIYTNHSNEAEVIQLLKRNPSGIGPEVVNPDPNSRMQETTEPGSSFDSEPGRLPE